MAEGRRDLAVAAGLAAGNLLERPPDPPLEGRGLEIEGKIQGSGTPFGHRLHGIEPALESRVVALDLGVRILLPELGLKEVVVVASVTAQTPRSVAATSSRPNGEAAVV